MNPRVIAQGQKVTILCALYIRLSICDLWTHFSYYFLLCQSSWRRGVLSHSVTRSSCQANLGPSHGIIPNGKQYYIPNSDRKFPKLCLKNDHFIVIFWKLIFLSCMLVFFVLFYLFFMVYFLIKFFYSRTCANIPNIDCPDLNCHDADATKTLPIDILCTIKASQVVVLNEDM